MLWNGSLARSVLPQQQSPEGDGQRHHERQNREQQRGRVAEVERVSKARSLRDDQRQVVPIDVEHSCPPGGWISLRLARDPASGPAARRTSPTTAAKVSHSTGLSNRP